MYTRRRGGFGVLMASVTVLLAALGVSMSTAVFRGGLASETQNFAEGRRALEIGRSCLAEAILHFRVQVNQPGTPWYETTRAQRTSANGMESWILGEYGPVATVAALGGEDADVAPVRVSVWRDFAIDKEHGPYDEKFALVTLTADVSVRREGFNPFRGTVRRQLQRSYHVKQTRIVAPQAFGRYALYVHRVPQLATQRDAYDTLIKTFDRRRDTVEREYSKEIDEVVTSIRSYLTWMAKKTKDWDKAREEIKKAKGTLVKLIAITPLGFGLPLPAVIKLKDTIEKMEKRLKDDIEKNLKAFNLADEATLRRVAANPYPPENLRTDIAFQLARGSWPTFRGHRATPEGLVLPGDNLENPVVVEREQVTSREIDYQLPQPPQPPVRPTYSLKSEDIQWLDRYGNIISEFRQYMAEYEQGLDGFLKAYALEFSRHEALFRLLPAAPPEFARHLMNLGYQARRATMFFENEEAFLNAVVGPDGLARLNGVYAVKGELKRFPARFEGRGFVTVESHVTLGGVQRQGEQSTAVFYSGGNVTLEGSCDAVVLAPNGRVKSRVLAQTVGLAALQEITREDEFTVQRRPELGADDATGLWVNVAPAPLAEALLRN